VIGSGVSILQGVKNCPFPLTKPVAVNTGWRYRAARDVSNFSDRRITITSPPRAKKKRKFKQMRVLAVVVCLSVCPSVCHKSVFY